MLSKYERLIHFPLFVGIKEFEQVFAFFLVRADTNHGNGIHFEVKNEITAAENSGVREALL